MSLEGSSAAEGGFRFPTAAHRMTRDAQRFSGAMSRPSRPNVRNLLRVAQSDKRIFRPRSRRIIAIHIHPRRDLTGLEKKIYWIGVERGGTARRRRGLH